MTQALDKNDIKVESDSLISIATKYYNSNEPKRAAYAWFYMARCADNRGNAKKQAVDLLKAQEFAQGTNNYKLLGLVYGDKGILYKTQGQTDSSIFYFKLANRSFGKINDYRNAVVNLINISTEFLKTSRYDSALNYCLLAENTSKKINDTLLNSTIYRTLGTVYFQQAKYKLALHYYKEVPLTHIAIYDSNKWYLLANVFVKTGKSDSARYYLNRVKELGEMAPGYFKLWQNIFEKEGNLKQALNFATKVTAVSDSLYKRKLDISFAGLEKKYDYQNLQISNQRLTIERKQGRILLLFVLLLLSFLSIIVLFWWIRVKKHQLNTHKQLVLQEKALLEKEKEKLEKEKENTALLHKQLKMHEILLLNLEQYRKNSVKRPESITSGNTSIQNPTFQKELIACMDLQYHDISIRLITKFPELTERDILICCLLLGNFDTGMISTLLDVKNESMNKQRHRLRTKLGLQYSDNLIDYLRSF